VLLFLCALLLNVVDLLCIGYFFWSVFLIAPILQALQYIETDAQNLSQNCILRLSISFLYDLSNWCYHLHLGLRTVLFLSYFPPPKKIFNLLSQTPHFSLFLFNIIFLVKVLMPIIRTNRTGKYCRSVENYHACVQSSKSTWENGHGRL